MSGREGTRSSFGRMSDVIRSSIATVGEKIEHGTISATTLNTLCNVIGAGVLSLPFALYNGSLVVGMILLTVCGFGSAFSTYAITRGCEFTQEFSMAKVVACSLFPKPKRGEDGEDATVSATALSGEEEEKEAKDKIKRDRMALAVTVIMFLFNYGTLIVYAKVIGDSIPPVIEDFLHGNGIWIQEYFWLIVGGVLFFVLTNARHMEELKWTSLMGFITIAYVVIIVVVRYGTYKADGNLAPSKEVHWFKLDMGALKTMPTFGLAFCYHYNVPFFYKELANRTPRKMMVSVAIAMPLTQICYFLTGALGYVTFGKAIGSTHAGGDIVNNYPKDDTAVNVGRLGLFFHFASVYPILAVAARRGLHSVYLTVSGSIKGRKNESTSESTDLLTHTQEEKSVDKQDDDELEQLDPDTRAGIAVEAFSIVSTSVLIAAFVPGIGIVIEIIGSLFGLFLMFIAPGMIGICVFGAQRKKAQQDQFGVPESFGYIIASWALAIGGTFFAVSSLYSIIDGFVN